MLCIFTRHTQCGMIEAHTHSFFISPYLSLTHSLAFLTSMESWKWEKNITKPTHIYVALLIIANIKRRAFFAKIWVTSFVHAINLNALLCLTLSLSRSSWLTHTRATNSSHSLRCAWDLLSVRDLFGCRVEIDSHLEIDWLTEKKYFLLRVNRFRCCWI